MSSQTINPDSKLQFQDTDVLFTTIITEGEGRGVVPKDNISVHYTGMLTDGSIFDSSYPRKKAFELKIGSNMVIQGWEQGILGMKVGEVRRIHIPSKLGYGDSGAGGLIPGGATLIFDVELLSIE